MDASMLMQMFVVMQREELTRQGSLGLSSTIGNQQIVFTLTIAFGFNSEHECQGKTEHATQIRGTQHSNTNTKSNKNTNTKSAITDRGI